MKSANPIYLHFLTPVPSLRKRKKLKNFIKEMVKLEEKEIEAINFIFCSDDYLLQINNQYLNHNTLTDIITFELSVEGSPLLSDIYISVDRVKENAVRLKKPFQEELHRVMFHGILHLCGYGDKTAAEKKSMRTKEDFYLKRFLVPRET